MTRVGGRRIEIPLVCWFCAVSGYNEVKQQQQRTGINSINALLRSYRNSALSPFLIDPENCIACLMCFM